MFGKKDKRLVTSRNREAKMFDIRKYEQGISDSGAEDYEKGLSGWIVVRPLI